VCVCVYIYIYMYTHMYVYIYIIYMEREREIIVTELSIIGLRVNHAIDRNNGDPLSR